MSLLAKKYKVDYSAIHYHIKKSSLEDDSWGMRQQQAVCHHTSFKCSGCGLYQDATRRHDYEVLRECFNRMDILEKLLRENNVVFEIRSSILKSGGSQV